MAERGPVVLVSAPTAKLNNPVNFRYGSCMVNRPVRTNGSFPNHKRAFHGTVANDSSWPKAEVGTVCRTFAGLRDALL